MASTLRLLSRRRERPPASFKRCLANLVSNAARHADAIAIKGHRDHRYLTVTIDDAGPGYITFLSNPKYAPKLRTTRASAVIAGQVVGGIPTLISANPYLDFARALELFYQPPQPKPGVLFPVP